MRVAAVIGIGLAMAACSETDDDASQSGDGATTTVASDGSDSVSRQLEGHVIPVLRQATAPACCRLGAEEPGQTADVHLDGA
jgi:hypothetical protein